MPRQTTKYSKPHLQSVIRLLEKRFVSNKKVFKEKKIRNQGYNFDETYE